MVQKKFMVSPLFINMDSAWDYKTLVLRSSSEMTFSTKNTIEKTYAFKKCCQLKDIFF